RRQLSAPSPQLGWPESIPINHFRSVLCKVAHGAPPASAGGGIKDTALPESVVSPAPKTSCSGVSPKPQHLRNVWDTGAVLDARCCQQRRRASCGFPAWIRTTLLTGFGSCVIY